VLDLCAQAAGLPSVLAGRRGLPRGAAPFRALTTSNDDYPATGGAAVDGTTLVLLGPHFGHVLV
jgi:hypothetical protein